MSFMYIGEGKPETTTYVPGMRVKLILRNPDLKKALINRLSTKGLRFSLSFKAKKVY